MKSLLRFLLVSAALIVMTVPLQSFAQAPDTVDVPFMIDNNPLGAINKFILGDTTATGERNNINRVYRLGRGLIYFFDSKMNCRFPLTLIAEDEDPNNPTPPPVLARGILPDGSSPNHLIAAYDDATFKNLYFIAIRPDQSPQGYGRAIELHGDSSRYVIENCVFDGWGSGAIRKFSNYPRIFIRDCYIRNEIHPTSWFGGNVFLSNVTPTDTVVMVNNTFFNSGSYLFCPNREITNYALIEHNTVFTNHVNIFYAPYVSNAFYRNNILFGICAMGQRDIEIEGGWFDWKGEISAIVSLDTIPPDIASRVGITEADRIVQFQNNAYFWPQKIKDFWASADTLTPPLWINNRTQAMLDDDENYPGLLVEGNLNADPGFNDNVMAQIDSLLKYVKKIRSGTQTDYRHYYYAGPGVPLFPPTWPIPEDLTYSNAQLLTAGTDGLPLGDLNWYPDKKAEWEQMQTSVKFKGDEAQPTDFVLAQNYPNPFNPTTTINFTLKKDGRIKLVVYNMLGQKVKTLLDKKMVAGIYNTTWNGQDDRGNQMASGVYYYSLESNNFKTTRKMVLMK